jgi:hypothetical protein
MNHTTLLRETRGQKPGQLDSTPNELGLEGAPDDRGRAE